jgi:fatty-acyl-CoA synthase
MPTSRHFADLVTELAERAPERTAVVAGDRTLTYGELDTAARDAADALRGLEVGGGMTVGLLCPNRAEWLLVALGALRLGARVAAFNTWAMAWDLEYMLRHSRAEVLVALDTMKKRDYAGMIAEMVPELSGPAEGWTSSAFPDLREVVFVGDGEIAPAARRFSELARVSSGREPVRSGNDDAFVLYTSGSSARPKAVPLRHGAAIENGFAIGERMGLSAEDRVLLPTPLFWSFGAVNTLPATLTHGATLVLQESFEAAGALALIERQRCTAIYTLPNITQALLAHERFTPERTRSLRTGLTIGRPEEVRRAADSLGAAEICNIYGSTETYGNCCVTPHEASAARRLESQGPPLPGTELLIADPQSGARLAAGEVGEILVCGHLAAGYLQEDGSTVEPIADASAWYHTGDLGHLDAEGWLHYASRATEMIKTGGINVSPAEIEEFLGLHPEIDDVAVLGAPDPVAGEVVVAFVVAARGAAIDASELQSWCRERIAAFKAPRQVHFVAELPKTDTGKLSRRLLRERFAELLDSPSVSA